jgi:DNA polymerase elongation subunit (family B)
VTRIVVDIETLALPLDTFDSAQVEYLLKFATSEAEREDALLKLNLYPATARVLAIGMLNPDSGGGRVFIAAPNMSPWASEDGSIQFIPAPEPVLLQRFWQDLVPYRQIITFNGRGFDCPFLLFRSAVLGIRPTRNLMGNRYDTTGHVDLLDQLTFYGAMRKFNLDFYCKVFGIDSPKEHGITGLDLAGLVEKGKYREVAEYCLGDVRATTELFRRWDATINFGSRR